MNDLKKNRGTSLDKFLMRHFCAVFLYICYVIFIFTYPSGWPKYCKTLRNIRRYYTLKCVQDIYRCVFILARFNKNVLQLNVKKDIGVMHI